jgi:hypothetical protein
MKKNTNEKKIKFLIPETINYTVSTDPKEESSGKCYMRADFLHSNYNTNIYPWIHVECYQTKQYKTNNRLTILHIRNKSVQTHNKLTIIYSHGNNDDLGTIYPLLIDLASQLKVIIVYRRLTSYHMIILGSVVVMENHLKKKCVTI